jgi:hypothetical protein
MIVLKLLLNKNHLRTSCAPAGARKVVIYDWPYNNRMQLTIFLS